MSRFSMAGGVLLAAVSTVSTVSLAFAQPPDDFYRNAQISLIIGFNAGGPYDAYARVAAAMLPHYIPGKPFIVARNMPGGGSVKAANFLFNQAPRDGLTIGVTGQQLAVSQALRQPLIEFDMRKFQWLGRFNLGATAVTVVWHTSPVKTIEDAKKTEVTIAATSAASTSVTLPQIMNRLIGTKFKIIRGYSGVNGTVLAMERGETDGAHATTEQLLSSKPDWLREKKISTLVQYSLHRNTAFADVPSMVELGATEQDKRVLAVFGSEPELGRSMMMPPGVPAERVAILRKAFAAMIADPAFKAEVIKRNLGFDPMSGEELQTMIQRTLDISPEVATRAIDLSKSD